MKPFLRTMIPSHYLQQRQFFRPSFIRSINSVWSGSSSPSSCPRTFVQPASRKPLRIIFCGSDAFSCASLQAVHDEHVRNTSLIASVDVLCRPGKPSGRGLKSVKEAPIKGLAQRLGLPVHERDTFTGWALPKRDKEPLNLLIAVSFGLLVPPRILRSVEYGGLNVHPSLLPDLRGPAPLHHALLNADAETGVTLQTLHPSRFDHGRVLLQENFPIPHSNSCTVPQLLEHVTPMAADILVKGLRQGVYLSNDASLVFDAGMDVHHGALRHAPKITAEDRKINWATMQPEELERRARVLGRVWCILADPGAISKPLQKRPSGKDHTNSNMQKRAVFEDLTVVDFPDIKTELVTFLAFMVQDGNVSYEQRVRMMQQGDHVIIQSSRSKVGVLVKWITIDGGRKTTAAQALFPERTSDLRQHTVYGV